MKINGIYKFKQDILKKSEMNAAMGFWFGFIYEKYKAGFITYDEAVQTILKMSKYTGV